MRRGIGGVALTLGVNSIFGFFGYFIAFLFAYGFSDTIDPAQHVFFLILVGALTLISATVSTFTVKAGLRRTYRQAAGFAFSVSAALNLLVLGLGSIISARHKDDGSVSEAFSTSTDVVVATVLLGGAVIGAWLVWRSWPRRTTP